MTTLAAEVAEVKGSPSQAAPSPKPPTRPLALVGFAEALAAPEAAWSLVDAGFEVIAFARKGRPAALRHSRCVVCHEVCAPESDLQASLRDLHSLLGSLGAQAGPAPRVLLPLDDMAVWMASRLEVEEAGWHLAGPQGSCAELALNKYLQAEAARAAGFNVPPTALLRSPQELEQFSAGAVFPLILKPAECVPVRAGQVSSCGKWICASRGELERAAAAWGGRVPLVVQAFIAGNGEGIFGLAAPPGVRAWSAHRRLRMMNPQGSGSSACASQAVAEDVKGPAERFIRQCGWQGLFMIELLRDASGKPWFVELNGRTWGSLALARRQGLEYPAWHARLALDAQSPAGLDASPAPGVVCRNLGRELMHLLFVLRGPKSKALSGWPPLGKTLAQVAWLHRGDTFYNWRRSDPRVFFADTGYTLQANLLKRFRF